MRSQLEIADIFKQYDHLLSGLLPDQHKVIRAIKNCRTSRLGSHKLKCNSCEYDKVAYNSCRNRHCPKCGFTSKSEWVAKRTDELLDCPYFHVVFTIPSELRPLFLRNKKVCYDLLFKASSETLKEVAKEQLNVDIGFFGVLHTWGQNLVDHPHIHFIFPGGGLTKKNKWKSCSENYLLPVQVLSKVFQAKVLKKIRELNNLNKLKFIGQICQLSHPGIFNDLLINCSSKSFVVYSKKPFAGPESVIKYLGNYTHRIAISNYRLIKMEKEKVHFKVRDKNNPGASKVMVLHVKEFMRRFLLHVLPKTFVRIRHFGLLGNRYKKIRIKLIRQLQGLTEKVVSIYKKTFSELMDIKIDRCPNCEDGKLEVHNEFKLLLSSA